jgi:hypothetical protein
MNDYVELINNFRNDIKKTYPELKDKLEIEIDYNEHFNYSSKLYNDNYMNILHERECLFDDKFIIFDHIDLSELMKMNITESTKKKIWKYLQLILFRTLGKNDKNKYDDIYNLLKNDNEFINSDFKKTMDNMLNSNIGSIAKEIAKETSEQMGDPKDYMENMFKDPSNIINLAQNIGNKLEKKMGEGSIDEKKLFDDASNIMDQFDNIPFMKNMMKQMGINEKVDFKSMQNKVKEKERNDRTKERLRNKLRNKAEDVPVKKSKRKRKNIKNKNI